MTLSSTCDEFLNALAECMDLCYDDGMILNRFKFTFSFNFSTPQNNGLTILKYDINII